MIPVPFALAGFVMNNHQVVKQFTDVAVRESDNHMAGVNRRHFSTEGKRRNARPLAVVHCDLPRTHCDRHDEQEADHH